MPPNRTLCDDGLSAFLNQVSSGIDLLIVCLVPIQTPASFLPSKLPRIGSLWFFVAKINATLPEPLL